MATDTTPPGHLSATAVRAQVEAKLRAKARERLVRRLTSWPALISTGVALGLAAAWVLR